MKSFSVLVLLLSLVTFVSGTVNDTPQQVVTKYNNYKTICTGLGYKSTQCNGGRTEGPVVFQSSYKGTLENLKTSQTVKFNQVSLNEGSAYNTTTGKFTAPLDGVYSFSWTTMSNTGKYFITEIVLNGIPMAYNYTDSRGLSAGHSMASSHANIKMKKGDRVWIRTHQNYGQNAVCGNVGQWCNFSGFKF
uniref:C1q domain-containing protein n=1 Tax=Magallana gigas TaxID=29159 RepID=A0A8W8LUQ8_MAGGI|nr:complement C1q tumor necrosis factor-related protein 3-like [Crassostrea gigas]